MVCPQRELRGGWEIMWRTVLMVIFGEREIPRRSECAWADLARANCLCAGDPIFSGAIRERRNGCVTPPSCIVVRQDPLGRSDPPLAIRFHQNGDASHPKCGSVPKSNSTPARKGLQQK